MNKAVDGQRLSMKEKRIAVVGYDASAKMVAAGLRRSGHDVTVGGCDGAASWVHAHRDGFTPRPSAVVVDDVDIVAVHLPADEHCSLYHRVLAPSVRPGGLFVFGSALALACGAFVPKDADVVVVVGDPSACRVALHTDESGQALERAVAYARAAYGEYAQVGTTTVALEAERELEEQEILAGGPAELVLHVERAIANARESHAPDEARVVYFEALHELVTKRRHAESGVRLATDAEAAPPPTARGAA
jgi:ketol-acid reductoisomerase